MENKVKFTRTAYSNNNIITLSLPRELTEFLDLVPGEKVHLVADEGNHGKFIAFWKKEEGDETDSKNSK